MRKITAGSLFSGVGGMDLGIEQSLADEGYDAETIFQVEADAWCRGILARHWPDTIRHDDVRSTGGFAPYAFVPPRVDIIHGGSPCTDLSYAGARGGLTSERSGLWYEQARIIDEVRPRVALWENVAGARSPIVVDGRTSQQPALGTVLGDLSACGYDAVWFTLRASDVGATHRRERVFVVAWRIVDDAQHVRHAPSEVAGGARARTRYGASWDGESEQPARSSGRRDGPDVVADAERFRQSRSGDNGGCVRSETRRHREASGTLHVYDGIAQSRMGGGAGRPSVGMDTSIAEHRWPARPNETQHEDEPPRVTTETEGRADRLRALGNIVVPQCGYVVGKVVAWALGQTA